jgi:hypothetical protein
MGCVAVGWRVVPAVLFAFAKKHDATAEITYDDKDIVVAAYDSNCEPILALCYPNEQPLHLSFYHYFVEFLKMKRQTDKQILAVVKSSKDGKPFIKYPDGKRLFCFNEETAQQLANKFNNDFSETIKIGGYKP